MHLLYPIPDSLPPVTCLTVTMTLMRTFLYILILLSLIPALLLGYQRVQYEQNYKTLAVLIDFNDLEGQSSRTGIDVKTLLERYRKAGASGVAVYEEDVQARIKRGDVLYRDGSSLRTQFITDTRIKPNWNYYTALTPGALDDLPDRYTLPWEKLELENQIWYGWPVQINGLPAGPNIAEIADSKAQGLTVVYRPFQDSTVKNPIIGFANADYFAFYGTQVTGSESPQRLEQVKAALGGRKIAFIEGVEQEGLISLLKDQPTVRLFALNPQWQARLTPEEVAGKFVLAARERSHRLLYMRPYPNPEATEVMLRETRAGLARAGMIIGNPGALEYRPIETLRYLSLLGPLAGLALLCSLYPLRSLAWTVGLLVLAGVAYIGGFDLFGCSALLAGVTFPALGLVMRRSHPLDWLLATALTLVGVAFLTALGTNLPEVLGLEPFRGVSLVLFLPIVLFALSLIPNQDIRKTAHSIYSYPIRLGDILLIGAVLGAAALIFLRRGNTTGAGASSIETKIRDQLQDTLIRPRFKELIGHPLAIIGLWGGFPPYLSALLLLGGVFGQASLMDTFAHYHTPLLISLQRAINGVLLGGVIGFLLIPVLMRLLGWFGSGRSSRTTPVPVSGAEGRKWRGGD